MKRHDSGIKYKVLKRFKRPGEDLRFTFNMAPRRHPLKRALLIGICYRDSKAPGFNALNAPHLDIAEMKNILISMRFSFPPHEIPD